MPILRWHTARRYYAATVYTDLLGDIVLAKCWGGRFNNLGRMSVTPVDSEQDGQAALYALARHRQQRGYHQSG